MNDRVTPAKDGKAVVEQFYTAVMTGSLDDFLALTHPDIEVHVPANLPWGGVHRTAESFWNLFPKIGAMINSASFKVLDIYGEGDRVFATVTADTIDGHSLIVGEDWRVREGRIDWVRVYYFDSRPIINLSAA